MLFLIALCITVAITLFYKMQTLGGVLVASLAIILTFYHCSKNNKNVAFPTPVEDMLVVDNAATV